MATSICRYLSCFIKPASHLILFIAILLILVFSSIMLAVHLSERHSYHSFSVHISDSDYPSITLPIVNAAPIIQEPMFNVYEDANSKERYFVVPTSLTPIEAERNTAWSIGLEREDGNHLILVTTLGPRANLLNIARNGLLAKSLNFTSIEYYPIEHFSIRPLTDPREPQYLNFTAIAAPGLTLTPFIITLIVQVTKFDNIVALKQLVNSNAGIILECSYILRKNHNGVVSDEILTAKATLSNMDITNLSM